jgi:hypothetical protein
MARLAAGHYSEKVRVHPFTSFRANHLVAAPRNLDEHSFSQLSVIVNRNYFIDLKRCFISLASLANTTAFDYSAMSACLMSALLSLYGI